MEVLKMIRKRKLVMGLAVLALMTLSMSLSMARSFPLNPLFLAPGLREQGAYTVGIPGTYGHLIPIRPFPWADVMVPTANGKEDDMEAHHTSPMATGPGTGSHGVTPPSSGRSGGSAGGGGIVAENLGMPMGNMLSGSNAASRVEYLENDLRDAIRKLNSK